MTAAGLAVYALGVALVLACSGWLLERALTILRLPVRWAWVGALALSVWLPLGSVVPRSQEQGTARLTGVVESVAPVVQAEIAEAPSGNAHAAGATLGSLIDWRNRASRALASGVALLPGNRVDSGWIAGAWGAFSILVAVFLIASILRLYRRAKWWPDETLLGRRVKVSPNLGPATVGFLKPLIVVPRWAKELPRHELELVLRHEGEHVASRDTLLLALGLVAVVACPWNPILWWQVRRLKAAVEVDCDRRVLRDGVPPARYGDLLLRVGSRGRIGSFAVPTIGGSKSLLERRLTIMKNSRRRTSLPAALAAMAVALLLAVVACTTEAPVATEPQAAAETATTTNGQPAYEPATAANTQTASEPATAPQAAEPRDELVARIWVDRDGTVRVNGVAKPVDRVSEAVAPLYSAGAVVSIDAHPAAPYRVVYALQEQLRAAGLLRVVFTTVESEALRPPPRDVSTLLDDGLATVLPEPAPRSEVEVSPRNLLFLEVLPTGIVAARRGEDTSIQEIAPREVEALWHQEVALNPHLIAIVRTHPDAEYRHMYDVVDALHRAKATRYSLQVAE